MRSALLALLLCLGLTAPVRAEIDAVAEFYTGHAALQQGKADDAVGSFTRAIQSGKLEQTQLAYVHHYRAVAYQRLDKNQEAIDDYTQALTLNVLPKQIQAAIYYNRAIALDRMANYERAIRDYTSAIALKSNYAEAYMNRGNAYRKLGDNQQALRDYDASAKYGNPLKHLPYYGKGLVLEQMGDKNGALEAFQTALSLQPDFEHARTKIAAYQPGGGEMGPIAAASGSTPILRPPVKPGAATPEEALSGVQTAALAERNGAKIPAASGVTAATVPMSGDLPKTNVDPLVEAAMSGPPAKSALDAGVSGIGSSASGASMPKATSAAASTGKPTGPAASGGAGPGGGPTATLDPIIPSKPAPGPAAGTQVASAAVPGAGVVAPATVAQPVKTSASQPAKVLSGFTVQVAAYKSEAAALTEAESILRKSGDVLTGQAQNIQKADLGEKGVFYRLRFGSFGSRGEAEKLCTALKAKGQSCNVVPAS